MKRTGSGFVNHVILYSVSLLAVLCFTGVGAASEKAACSIRNFHEVEPGLYRGGQPKEKDFACLKELGVKTVIDFRPGRPAVREREWAGKHQIRFVSIPWNPADSYSYHRTDTVLKVVTNQKNRPLFVHCKGGRDRTGFMIAAYRIAANGWSERDALQEMRRLGYQELKYPELRWDLHRFARRYHRDAAPPLFDRILGAALWLKELPFRWVRFFFLPSPLG